MDDSKKHLSFEEKWQEAFNDAEEAPAAGLWKNIESSINATESSQYKRRFIFYRTVAAAAVACLLVLGIFTFGDRLIMPFTGQPDTTLADQKNKNGANTEAVQNNTTQNNGQQQTNEQSEGIEQENSISELADNVTPQPSAKHSGQANEKASAKARTNDKALANQSETQPTASDKMISEPDRYDEVKTGVPANAPFNNSDRSLTLRPNSTLQNPLYSGAPVTLAALPANGVEDLYAQPIEALTVEQQIYRIPVVIQDDKKTQPVFFAGVNVSTGYFNPNFNSVASAGPQANSFDNDITNFYSAETTKLSTKSYYQNEPNNYDIGENNTAQLSFSYGVDFGWALSEHWSLESGLDYGRLQTSTASSLAVRNRSNQELYPLLITNNNEVGANSGYSAARYTQADLNSYFDFFSVPLKVGYNINFNKLNVVFASGVSANFFVKNSVTDNTGQLNALTIKAGNGPFRNVYYSALLSSGVNYNILNNYFVTIVPTYSFSINSLSREESGFKSQPYSFGVDFGIRYIF